MTRNHTLFLSRFSLGLFLLLTVHNLCHAQIITTIAGNGVGTGTYTGDGGPATDAGMDGPSGVTMDRAGNLYITEFNNHVVRKVSTTGIISTIAGTGTNGYNGDGIPATAARLYRAADVVIDDSGKVYIADGSNYRVRRIELNDTISTYAGNGTTGFSGDGGSATMAQLSVTYGIVMDKNGNLYIANQSTQRIRKVTPGGIISTIAGNGSTAYTGDGGPATNAGIYNPHGMAIDRKGNLYVAEIQHNCIRKIDTFGIITTVAGTGVFGYSGDGGAATAATLRGPNGVAVDTIGNLYIADCSSHRIRKVDTFGIITTFAGNGTNGFGGDGGAASAAMLSYPVHVYIDSAGAIYVTDNGNDRVRKIIFPTPTQQTLPAVKDLAIYPVPMSNELIIENATTGTSINILNIAGELVYSGQIHSSHEKISTGDFAPGMYQLQLVGSNGQVISKTIIRQ